MYAVQKEISLKKYTKNVVSLRSSYKNGLYSKNTSPLK